MRLDHPFSLSDLRREMVRASTAAEVQWPVHRFRQLVTQAIYGASRPASEYVDASGKRLPGRTHVPLVRLKRLYGLFVRAIGRESVTIEGALFRNLLRQASAPLLKMPEDFSDEGVYEPDSAAAEPPAPGWAPAGISGPSPS
jgi:hypothetical protein